MSIISGVSDFQSFAVLATLDTTAFNNWINTQKTAQKAQTQNLVKTTHNEVPHTDVYGTHYDTNYVNIAHQNVAHYDYYSTHTDVPHVDEYHEAPHNDAHNDFSNQWGHVNWTHVNWPAVNWYNQTGYGNIPAYHNETPSKDIAGYNQAGYCDTPHNEAAHTDVGVNHQEYVPYTPAYYNISASKCINGTFTIGFYSYDANIDGQGSQDANSKTVQYTLQIRKVKNLDGTANVSNWRVLVSNTTANTYDLNTIDPLGTSNTNPVLTEGYYEIQATASNPAIRDAQGTVTNFISPPQVVQVLICQNTTPDITVTNANDFINFYFNNDGLAKDTVFKSYDQAWTNPRSGQTQGLYVSVSMADQDSSATSANNFQKGYIYLQKPDGNVLTSTVPIYWNDTGNTVTSSQNNGVKTGYAYIPKENFISSRMNNVIAVVQIQDFLDSGCSQSLGDPVIRKQVSLSDLRSLNINIGWPIAQVPVLSINNARTGSLDINAIESNLSLVKYQISTVISGVTKYVSANGQLIETPQWIVLTNKKMTVYGLDANTTYSFSAKAMNGDNVVTVQSASVSGTTLTAVPTNLTAFASGNKITLKWDNVLGATKYSVSFNGGANIVQVAVPYFELTGVNQSSKYTFQVRSENANGNTEWSNPIDVLSRATIPGVPQNLTATADNTSVTLNWGKVSNATDYQILIDGNIINSGSASTYKDMGLLPGTEHKYKVRAVNSGGKSEWTNELSVSTKPLAPNVPSNISISTTADSVLINWATVQNTSGYEIEIDNPNLSDTDNSKIVAISTNSYNHLNLHTDEVHSYRIRTIINGIPSEWSPAVSIKVGSNPNGVPTNIQTTEITESSISLVWNNVDGATSYEIEQNGVIVGKVTGLTYKDDRLKIGTSYTYRIRGINSSGYGGWCTPVTYTTASSKTLGIPGNIIATPTSSSICLIWNPVNSAIKYDIEINGSQQLESVSGNVYLVSNLNQDTEYKLRIRAVGSNNIGSWSGEIVSKTLSNSQSSSINQPTHVVMTSDAKTGESFIINLSASNISDLENSRFIITYNPSELNTEDLYANTLEIDDVVGVIQGSLVNVEEKIDGKIIFSIKIPESVGKSFDGLVTAIKMRALQDGTKNISYDVININEVKNANLSNLYVNNGQLTPIFDRENKNYEVNVESKISNITIIPVAEYSGANIKINGNRVLSGQPSASLELNVGENVIPIEVASEDGSNILTYVITVKRASGTAYLKGLSVSAGALSPSFSQDLSNYTLSVANSVYSTTVTPESLEVGTVIRVNGVIVDSGQPSEIINLNVGNNIITVDILSIDGITKVTYTLNVIRARESEILIVPNPTFNQEKCSISVPNEVCSLAMISHVLELGAIIKVNGILVTNGQSSEEVILNEGINIIIIESIAEDGVTKRIYTIEVNRASKQN